MLSFLLSARLGRAQDCTNSAWSQCAGTTFTGETCCPDGTSCQQFDEWWSGCVSECPAGQGWDCETLNGPTPKPTPNPTSPPVEPSDCTNAAWAQCGGNGFTGSTCCPADYACTYGNDWWSSCLPAVADQTPSPTQPPVDPTPSPTESPTQPPVPTAEPTPSPTTDSSYDVEGFECQVVDFTWTLEASWSTTWQGHLAFTAPEPGNWVLVLEAPSTSPEINSIAWWDGDAAERLTERAFKLDPNDAWWNGISDISFLISFDGFEPSSDLIAHYCIAPIDFSLFISSETEHDVAASVVGIVGLMAQSMWESGGDDPWSACDENNYTDSPTASCTQRDDGTLYTDVQSPVGCEVDLSMTMSAETSASWATLGPMECTPGTDTEGCCWWGRGAIQTTGPHNYGVLQRDVVSSMSLEEENGDPVDLCLNPEAMCQHEELKCVGAAYYWTTVVQAEDCYFSAIDTYIESGYDASASTSSCYSFASGIGGSVNNGMWNSDAHGNTGRLAYFDNLMAPVITALDSFTLGDVTSGAPLCTGNEEIDFILASGNLAEVSLINDSPVYTWDGFCIALRQMNAI